MDKPISELIEALSVLDEDLYVLEQGGEAKKLKWSTFIKFAAARLDGHGGIQSIALTGTSGLADTYTITLADAETYDIVVKNGRGISGIAKTGTSGLVDTYTITYNDGGTKKITVTNGAKGDPGNNAYVWIKYASQEPTEASHSMGDVPDAWMGVYSGNAATAPTDWTQYKWYKIEGRQGDTGAPAALISSEVTYQVSDSGTIIPSGEWTASVPVVAQGKYLWTRIFQQYNTGSPITAYSVSRMGMDGLGSVSSVCNVSPDADGNVELSASDVGALPTTGGDLTGELRMNGQPISGLNEPTEGTQAAPKSYVDKRVPLDGSVPMTGNLPMGAHRITDLAKPEDDGDAATKGYTDDAIEKLLKKSGGIMTGEINMNGQPISGLNAPTEDTQAARKGYVDSNVRKAAPRNLLDNSDFANLVAQAGIGGNHGTIAYAADRWILDSGTVSYAAGVGLTLNGTIRQKLEFPPTGETSAFVGMASGAASISYADGAVTITSSGGVLKWAALYGSVYSAATMPEYHPKGYAAELAECQRYFYSIISYWKWVSAGICTSSTACNIPIKLPQAMRIMPTVTIADRSLVKIKAGSASPQVPNEVSWSNITRIFDMLQMACTITGATNGNIAVLYFDNGGRIDFSADL